MLRKGVLQKKVLKERIGKECRVKRVPYKVHQSIRDVKEMLNTLLPEHTVLVHALKEDTDRLQKKSLARQGMKMYIHLLWNV